MLIRKAQSIKATDRNNLGKFLNTGSPLFQLK